LTAHQFLRWLAQVSPLQLGVPMSRVPVAAIGALEVLQRTEDIFVTSDPPLVWLNPRHHKPWRRREKTRVILESDLPADVPLLKHTPDRADAAQLCGKRNGDPLFRRLRDEPSDLYAMGRQPWPPSGCKINPRQYVPARAEFTIELIHDMDVVDDLCPVCGRTEAHANCLVCDAKPVRSKAIKMDPMPEPERKTKPKRKKTA